MNKTCQKCGVSLQENDFLCPNCGAIYGQPVYEAPKQEEKPAPVPKKRRKLPLVVVPVMGLLVAIVCVLLWNPFQPAQTPTTAPAATTVVFPTTSAVPTPPPTTEPATVPTTVPQPTITVPKYPTLDIFWPMHAMLVTADGEIKEMFPICVEGNILFKENHSVHVSFDIQMPDTFRYMCTKPDGYAPSVSGKIDGLSYYVWQSYCYDRDLKDFCFGSYGLCTQKQYLIMSWQDDEELYLVASLEESADPTAILSYFQGFIDKYSFEK